MWQFQHLYSSHSRFKRFRAPEVLLPPTALASHTPLHLLPHQANESRHLFRCGRLLGSFDISVGLLGSLIRPFCRA